MMRFHIPLLAAFFAATLMLAPTGQAQDDEDTWEAFGDEVAESWSDFQKTTVEQRDTAVAAGEALVENLDRRIEALDKRAEEASEEAAEEWREQRAALVEQRDELALDVEELAEVYGERFDYTLEAAANTYEEAVSRLGEAWDALTG